MGPGSLLGVSHHEKGYPLSLFLATSLILHTLLRFSQLIPLSFLLGFYMSLVMTWWWNQFEALTWPDELAMNLSSYLPGQDRARDIRRVVVRWFCLAKVLALRMVSHKVKKRFPPTRTLSLTASWPPRRWRSWRSWRWWWRASTIWSGTPSPGRTTCWETRGGKDCWRLTCTMCSFFRGGWFWCQLFVAEIFRLLHRLINIVNISEYSLTGVQWNIRLKNICLIKCYF